MPLSEPTWWYPKAPDDGSWLARLCTPLAAVYAFVANRRMLDGDGLSLACPVICVGNFTAGGTGKTPLASWIASYLTEQGHAPVFLSRGYGGQKTGPVWVDASVHTAVDVGDEPLLLAHHAPVMIARDRVLGAKAIVASGRRCDAIIMDDGLQNPALNKDLSISVVDAGRGIGNGLVIPAGPLRATLSVQAAMTDVVIINCGAAQGDPSKRVTAITSQLNDAGFQGSILGARTVASGDTYWLSGARVLAFAGIGNPDRFFATLEGLGAEVVDYRWFRDHQFLSEADARALNERADEQDLMVVTTEKDMVRLMPVGPEQKKLKVRVRPVAVKTEISDVDQGALSQHIDAVLRRGTHQGA